MASNFARASASCAQLDSLLGLRPDALKELLARRHLRGRLCHCRLTAHSGKPKCCRSPSSGSNVHKGSNLPVPGRGREGLQSGAQGPSDKQPGGVASTR
jgi:hypothetical protein